MSKRKMAFPKVLLYDYDRAFCTHTARANCQSAVVEMPTCKIKTEGENMRGRYSLGRKIGATSFNDAGDKQIIIYVFLISSLCLSPASLAESPETGGEFSMAFSFALEATLQLFL